MESKSRRELEHALAALGDWHDGKQGGPALVHAQMIRRKGHDPNAAKAFRLASFVTSEHLGIDTPKEQTAAMRKLAPVLLELLEEYPQQPTAIERFRERVARGLKPTTSVFPPSHFEDAKRYLTGDFGDITILPNDSPNANTIALHRSAHTGRCCAACGLKKTAGSSVHHRTFYGEDLCNLCFDRKHRER
jgi:hypothetical protein